MVSPFRERLIAPAEVRRIVRRAAEIASTDGVAAQDGQPMTGEELERQANALGIPDDAVQRAIAEFDGGDGEATDDRGPVSVWTGTRVPITFDDIAWRSCTNEDFDEIAHVLATDIGEGTLHRDGSHLTWRPTAVAGSPPRPLVVSISSRGGRTNVRIEERIGGLAGGLIGGVGLGVGIPLLIVSTILLAALADAGLMAVIPGLAFMAFLVAAMTLTVRAVARSRERQLKRLMRRIRDVLDAGLGIGTNAIAASSAGVRVAVDAGEKESVDANVGRAESAGEGSRRER